MPRTTGREQQRGVQPHPHVRLLYSGLTWLPEAPHMRDTRL